MDMNDFYDPFKNLVIGILSQNTNDKNSTRAYIGLIKKFGKITPHVLAKAGEGEIRNAIKSGGLYNIKAKRIKNLAKTVLKINFSEIAKLPKEEAREKLLELPGIGPKTADVWLAYCVDHYIMPVDTNVNRVAKRLGIVSPKANYEEIKTALEKIIPKKQRVRGHELLVRLGRDYCKPKNPLCEVCPVTELCKKIIIPKK